MRMLNLDWWKWLVICAVSFFCLSFFCRCSTKQKIVERQTFLTDKKNEKKFDSLFQSRLLEEFERSRSYTINVKESDKKDRTFIRDSIASRYDANGNKIGEDKYHYERHEVSEKEYQQIKDSLFYYKSYKDSSSIYQAKCDSLNCVISKMSKDKEYVEKGLSKSDKFFLRLGKVVSVLLFIGVLAFIGWIYWRLKLHK